MSSHRQIFKSTALVGGSQIVNLGIGILRTKALALLLGPSGIGLAGLYLSATTFIGSITGLGINTSGVREIAAAAASEDEARMARTVVILRRLSILSGALGMFLVLALAPILSRATFGDERHTSGVALMSLTLLFAGVSAGQAALLQGLRKLRELASSQVIGVLFGAVVSIALVWTLGQRGVVFYLVVISAFSVVTSWWYARRIVVLKTSLSWKETLRESRSLLGLGLAFTTAALASNGSAFLTRVFVQRELGIDAVGVYTATWTLTTYYVGFVLTAMGADFMPRLTTAAGDRQRINQLVNEQAEMGVLIAVPGVVATLTFAPWVLKLFYSEAFVHGADVARWQILGVFLRVVCWPLGYIIVALGKSAVYAVCELLFGVASVLLVVPCIHLSGLVGIGISFAVVYLFYSVMVFLVARRLTGFFWSSSALAIILGGSLILALTFACVSLLPLWWGTTVGLVITVFSAVTSFLMLQKLLRIDLWDLARQKLAPLRA